MSELCPKAKPWSPYHLAVFDGVSLVCGNCNATLPFDYVKVVVVKVVVK